jgi:hypothetical protein
VVPKGRRQLPEKQRHRPSGPCSPEVSRQPAPSAQCSPLTSSPGCLGGLPGPLRVAAVRATQEYSTTGRQGEISQTRGCRCHEPVHRATTSQGIVLSPSPTRRERPLRPSSTLWRQVRPARCQLPPLNLSFDHEVPGGASDGPEHRQQPPDASGRLLGCKPRVCR